MSEPPAWWQRWQGWRNGVIALLALLAIALHLLLYYGAGMHRAADWPLWTALALGGLPLVGELTLKLFRGQFGSDLLAGISIVTAVLLGEYLAGTLVVLMLSGGETIEAFAVRRASAVLEALASRMPAIAHRRQQQRTEEIPLEEIRIGDLLVVFPHEICPVDGTVVEGHGVMDESYLTGEPYKLSKTPGSGVLSGAVNGEAALTIRADRLPVDSRYARIMQVMKASEQQRPRLRRLGDQLGAIYTPIAVTLALLAWLLSGEPVRFLAVLVVATPCPLLIAIPVAIIGAISLAAQRGIIIRDPAVLERADACRTLIFDKTGTLTYGRPRLTAEYLEPGQDADTVLQRIASLEQYSKHPLASAIVREAKQRKLMLSAADEMHEPPGQGLRGMVAGHPVQITSRKKLLQQQPELAGNLPPVGPGLECVVLIDDRYAGTLQFRDEPRRDSASFIHHLRPKHAVKKVMLVSGDRESEVRYLADKVGITDVSAGKSPEEKLEIVRRETAREQTLYLGDGINDAPALTVATVGVAFGQHSEITSEAAGAVILDSSLEKVDELIHIRQRMKTIALQSAVGGMLLSIAGMLVAAAGYLPPVAGAVVQEIIDVVAVLNALRVALAPGLLTDFESTGGPP